MRLIKFPLTIRTECLTHTFEFLKDKENRFFAHNLSLSQMIRTAYIVKIYV